jgi:hypothetical protein
MDFLEKLIMFLVHSYDNNIGIKSMTRSAPNEH